MSKVLSTILDSLFQKLETSTTIDEPTLDELETLLRSGEKLKADDIVSVLWGSEGDPTL